MQQANSFDQFDTSSSGWHYSDQTPSSAVQAGEIAGALVPTFLISRLVLWLLRSWDGKAQKLMVAHGVSLLLISFIAGIGMADGGAFAGLHALGVYWIPQAAWFIVDVVRYQKRFDKP